MVCEACNYSTKHGGQWNRHVASARHCRRTQAVVKVGPPPAEDGKSGEQDAAAGGAGSAAENHNVLLRDTIRQLHDLLLERTEELRNALTEISTLQKTIRDLSEKNVVIGPTGEPIMQEVNNTVSNTFIFVLDEPCIGSDGLIGIMKRMHKKVAEEYGGRVGNSDVVILGLKEVQARGRAAAEAKEAAKLEEAAAAAPVIDELSD